MPTQVNANTRVHAAIKYALAQVGKPYIWATAGPNSFDCSGLVWKAYEIGAGYRFTGRPTTYTLVGMGKAVSKEDIKPGDLIFPNAGHVQMALGGGRQVEAANSSVPLRTGPITETWRIRRLIENGLSDSGTANATDPNVDPSDGGSDTDSQLAALNNALSFLTSAQNWVNILYVILGIILCLTAMARMGGSDIIGTISKVSK